MECVSSLHGNKYLAEAQKSWLHPCLEHCQGNPLLAAPFPLACPTLFAPSTSFHLCLGDTSLGAPGHKDLLRAATSLGTQRPCEQSPAPISEMPFSVFECSGCPEPAPSPVLPWQWLPGRCVQWMHRAAESNQAKASVASPELAWPPLSALPPAAKEPSLSPQHVAGAGNGGNSTCLSLLRVPISPCPASPGQLSPWLQERWWQEHGREILAIHLHM